jgi:hypothetical protein
MKYLTRDGILGHKFDKRLGTFTPCYSQSFLSADFKENHTVLWFYKYKQKNPRNNYRSKTTARRRRPVLPELVNALRLKGAEDLWLLATELETGIVAEPEATALLVAPVLKVVAAEGAARLQVQAQHLRERPLVQVHLAQAQAQPFLKNT